MELMYTFLIFLLGLNFILGFIRVFRGPELVDSMMASLLLGTGGTSIVLALYRRSGESYYIDLALAFALLAGVIGIAFTTIVMRKHGS